MQTLPATVQRAIEALQRHHYTEAAPKPHPGAGGANSLLSILA